MPEVVNGNTRITFGLHRGHKVSDCPDDYLKWMSNALWDTDLHVYALAAREVLAERQRCDAPVKNLEDEADAFLRKHGVDPSNFNKSGREKVRRRR